MLNFSPQVFPLLLPLVQRYWNKQMLTFQPPHCLILLWARLKDSLVKKAFMFLHQYFHYLLPVVQFQQRDMQGKWHVVHINLPVYDRFGGEKMKRFLYGDSVTSLLHNDQWGLDFICFKVRQCRSKSSPRDHCRIKYFPAEPQWMPHGDI